jgi:hypothetical protein
MITGLAWLVIALAVLVTALISWMTWQRLAGAAREPLEPEEEQWSNAEREAPGAPGEPDEQGYLSRRALPMGCEAAICRTPFGARIVAGKSGLRELQYAWDYASVSGAHRALTQSTFTTHRNKGIVIEESGAGPAAGPQGYLRRWKYTHDAQMQRS